MGRAQVKLRHHRIADNGDSARQLGPRKKFAEPIE
jgi:hypothetical protein